MIPEVLEYLKTQRIGVIALEMPDGMPHGSTVHFAHIDEPATFIFLTQRSYRKGEALTARPRVRASLVVGSNEGDMKTLQLDGEAALSEDDAIKEAYFAKFPKKREQYEAPDVFSSRSPPPGGVSVTIRGRKARQSTTQTAPFYILNSHNS